MIYTVATLSSKMFNCMLKSQTANHMAASRRILDTSTWRSCTAEIQSQRQNGEERHVEVILSQPSRGVHRQKGPRK